VKDFTRIVCDSNHNHYNMILLIPLFLIWAVLYPGLSFLYIYKNRSNLNNVKMRFSTGMFYNEYKKICFYWEFVKIYLKLIIIFAINYFDSAVQVVNDG